jgi:chromosome segregation ATPase
VCVGGRAGERQDRLPDFSPASPVGLNRGANTLAILRDIRAGLRAELDDQQRRAEPEIAYARTRVTEMDTERRRLARAVVSSAISEDLAREEQERIRHELAQAQNVLATAQVIYSHIEGTLNRALALVGRIDEVYAPGRTEGAAAGQPMLL